MGSKSQIVQTRGWQDSYLAVRSLGLVGVVGDLVSLPTKVLVG